MTDYYKIKYGYAEFLNRFNWELHFTFSFNRNLNLSAAQVEVRKYLKRTRHRFSKIKYAGIILATNPHNEVPHIHMLLTSDPRYPRRLTDISSTIIKFIGFSWDLGTCEITTCNQWENETISWYLTKRKNLPLHDPDRYEIYFYRPNLLKQLRL